VKFPFHFKRRNERERELDEEIRAHLALAIRERIEQGEDPAEAEANAHREFGNVPLVKEVTRDMWGWRWVETFLQDVRYGLRQLRRNPGFTAVAILTLALGIGANTAIFSLIDAVLLNLLPVKDPQELVLLSRTDPHGSFEITNSGYSGLSFAYPFVEQLRSQRQVFSSVFGFVPMGWGKGDVNVSVDGRAGMATGTMVTGGYFSGLGITPVLGRTIRDSDVKENAPRVAVISYDYWTRRFGRAPSAAGKAITLNGVPFTIVGVAPPEFFGVQPDYKPDVWIPLVPEARLGAWGMPPPYSLNIFTRPDWWWVMVMGRIRPGVTTEQALAVARLTFLQSAAAATKEAFKPADAPQLTLRPARRGLDTLRREFSEPLWTLMIVAGFVLLIACANIATLLLARGAARRREIGIRLALGAPRLRLARQFMTESLLLSGAGGALGLLIAGWGSRVLLLLMSRGGQNTPVEPHIDLTVLGFTAGVSLLTGILFGLAPAVHSTRRDAAPALKEVTSSLTAPGSRLRLGSALVIAQVALALMLLAGAGLFVRTLMNLENVNLGFNRSDLLVFTIDPTKSGYEGQRVLHVLESVRERLQQVPGVQAATLTGSRPLTGWGSDAPISIEGYQVPPGRSHQIEFQTVGPDFCQTMQIRLLLGRCIAERDTAKSKKVAVVEQGMARYYFGDSNPIGRRFSFSDTLDPADAYEIIGVVENTRYRSLRAADSRTLYIPYTQTSWPVGAMNFEVRTAGDPGAFVPGVRDAVHEIDADLALADVKTQTQLMAEALWQQRLFAVLCSFFGALALLLSSIGLYGLMAYSVARRIHEIGVRMALGAQRSDILNMVLGQGAKLMTVGVAIGIMGALALTRFMSSQLYGVKPTDPLTFVVVSLILIVVALLACYIPTRRAAKVDPMVALRYE
jgi:macrolide transport system ATP-binding/permease protein